MSLAGDTVPPLAQRLGERGRAFLKRASQWRLRPSAAWLVPLACALVLAAIAHILSILSMPSLAERNAFARLADRMDSNVLTVLPDPSPREAVLPMMDPAFITAVCLYDLSERALKVQVPATTDYTSVSFFTDGGLAFYAVSDKAAGKVIELDLMTADQRAALPEDEEITAADRLVVESPTEEGIVLVRALVRERGMRDAIRQQLEAASCEPVN